VSDLLTIRELAGETGVAPGTLRMWEARHGFPRPERAAGGHRRYRREDAVRVAEVLRHRAAGLSLPAAVERVRGWAPEPDRSIFAALRRRRPDLPVQRVDVPVMLAMSRAMEDECLARAGHAVLAGSFEHARHFRPAAERWHELARTADVAFVLADFPRAAPRAAPARVPIAPGDPAAREWAVVCVSAELCACLAGWELPAERPAAPPAAPTPRRFEAIWSSDDEAAATALEAACALAEPSSPQVAARARARLEAMGTVSSEERLRASDRLVSRMLGHLAARR
jgi:DICT domain-containing protein